MATMHAIVQREYGSADVLQLQEVPRPEVGPGQILVRVRATSVTQADCAFRTGTPWIARIWSGLWRPRHQIPGMSVAGDVVALGEGVTSHQVGDRVAGVSMQAGTYAEYAVLSPGDVINRFPEALTYEQAAAALGAQTALWFLRDTAQLKPGQRVLINGASGEVGSTGVQIARHLGASVTAVCSGRNADLVRALGADEVVDYTKEDFSALDQRFDVVFDAVGKSSFSACRRILAPGGLYMTTVPSLGVLLHMLRPWGRRRATLQTAGLRHTGEQFQTLFQMVADGALTPHVDTRGTLQDVPEAHRYVETGHKRGQVLILPV